MTYNDIDFNNKVILITVPAATGGMSDQWSSPGTITAPFGETLGFTPLAIGTDSDAGLSLPVDINYYLPINLSGFKFALNMHAQRTLAYPNGQDGDATDFIYMGLLINTPLAF